jgi:hypothetical protein
LFYYKSTNFGREAILQASHFPVFLKFELIKRQEGGHEVRDLSSFAFVNPFPEETAGMNDDLGTFDSSVEYFFRIVVLHIHPLIMDNVGIPTSEPRYVNKTLVKDH